MTDDLPEFHSEFDLDNVYKAYVKFRKLMNLAANKNSARLYYRFLGDKKAEVWKEVTFTQQANDRVNWLLSDNAEIMFKIWLAQNEDAL